MIVANLSGGRDSTAMVIKWLEMGKKLDYVIFCDTKFEFKEMYSYIDKIEKYLDSKFNIKLTRLSAESGIYDWSFVKPICRGQYINRLRGIPKAVGKEFCTRETKIKPTRDFVLDKSPNKYKNTILIGYTYNEVENGRTTNLEYGISEYPLHTWRMNEAEVSEFLKERGIMNPLYERFKRTGCFLCPKQSLASLYNLYRYYPQEWELMKSWEAKAKALNCVTTTFRSDGKSLLDLESRFKEKSQNVLFDLDSKIDLFEMSETCFCKG